MKTFGFTFTGRKLGAIGTINNLFHKRVNAETIKEASLKLYDEFEHISFKRFGEVTISKDGKVIKVINGFKEIYSQII